MQNDALKYTVGSRIEFRTVTDTDLRPRNGTPATVIAIVTEPNERFDAEVLPMYRIRFDDGFETDAFTDELFDAP